MPRPFHRHGGRHAERRPRDQRRPAGGRLPEVAVVQVTGTDKQGDAIARPVSWDGDGPPPLILMAPEPRGRPALAPGQRVLARLRPIPGRLPGRTATRAAASAGWTTRPAASSACSARGRARPHHPHRPPRQGGMDGAAGRGWRRRGGRDRAGRAVAASPARAEAGAGDRAARQHGRRPLGQPDRHPHARHSAGVPRRGAGRGGGRPRLLRSAGAPTCARCRWSPSTARMRAISTMRCSPNPTAPAASA